MSEHLIDISFMKRTEIVQAIRNASSLDDALKLINGFAANGWLHLWDNAKHPDGTSMRDKWKSNEQAEIERLKGQRDRLVARFKGKEWKGHVTDALIAEIEAGK